MTLAFALVVHYSDLRYSCMTDVFYDIVDALDSRLIGEREERTCSSFETVALKLSTSLQQFRVV
jgi:hypothetical protein